MIVFMSKPSEMGRGQRKRESFLPRLTGAHLPAETCRLSAAGTFTCRYPQRSFTASPGAETYACNFVKFSLKFSSTAGEEEEQELQEEQDEDGFFKEGGAPRGAQRIRNGHETVGHRPCRDLSLTPVNIELVCFFLSETRGSIISH